MNKCDNILFKPNLGRIKEMLIANGFDKDAVEGLTLIEPKKGTPDSAAWDIFAQYDFEVSSIGALFVDLGFQTEIPKNHYVKIVPRSGHGSLRGLTIRNGTGIIDEDYRDNWGAVPVLDSLPEIKAEPMMRPLRADAGERRMTIKRGQAFAQMILCEKISSELEETTKEWEQTARKGGHGHTGN